MINYGTLLVIDVHNGSTKEGDGHLVVRAFDGRKQTDKARVDTPRGTDPKELMEVLEGFREASSIKNISIIAAQARIAHRENLLTKRQLEIDKEFNSWFKPSGEIHV